MIENYVLLREALLQRGHIFRSQTDTEVAAHMVEEELETLGRNEGALAEALRRVSLKSMA